jgi:hypothetical protein
MHSRSNLTTRERADLAAAADHAEATQMYRDAAARGDASEMIRIASIYSAARFGNALEPLAVGRVWPKRRRR